MRIRDLQNGNLLFMRDVSEMSQAIQKATGQYSHVAIYFDAMIYHATKDKGVIKQKLNDFLENDSHAIFVYRYPDIKVEQVQAAAEHLLGRPYNHSFYPDDDGFYCSQYIAEMLPIFPTIPMQFADDKYVISEFWQQYYDDLGVAVPLNQPGTNPSQLAQSENLQYLGELHD